MNVRHLVPSVSRRLLAVGSLMLATGLQQPVHASGVDLSASSRSTSRRWEIPVRSPGAMRNRGACGFWTRARGECGWTATSD